MSKPHQCDQMPVDFFDLAAVPDRLEEPALAFHRSRQHFPIDGGVRHQHVFDERFDLTRQIKGIQQRRLQVELGFFVRLDEHKQGQ